MLCARVVFVCVLISILYYYNDLIMNGPTITLNTRYWQHKYIVSFTSAYQPDFCTATSCVCVFILKHRVVCSCVPVEKAIYPLLRDKRPAPRRVWDLHGQNVSGCRTSHPIHPQKPSDASQLQVVLHPGGGLSAKTFTFIHPLLLLHLNKYEHVHTFFERVLFFFGLVLFFFVCALLLFIYLLIFLPIFFSVKGA